MKTLVIGGTGTVGSKVVRALLDRGGEPRVMTSSPAKLSALPNGVKGVVGNLNDRSSVQKACDGVEQLFFVTPHSEQETEEGMNAVEAARATGIRRIVYMSVHRLEDIRNAPHFARKIPVEDAVKQSGIRYTIIRPNNFYQNDLWFRQPIADYGVYPQPIGNVGIHRVDVRDIAEAIANALSDDAHSGKTYNLVGREKNTGDDSARLYSKHLGKPVRYAGDDLNAWAAQARQMLPGWLVEDFRIMYDHFQRNGLLATPEHHAETERIVGHMPRSFDSFVAETVASWTS